jgi:hypothetical protein
MSNREKLNRALQLLAEAGAIADEVACSRTPVGPDVRDEALQLQQAWKVREAALEERALYERMAAADSSRELRAAGGGR